jgi:hypothetical protein
VRVQSVPKIASYEKHEIAVPADDKVTTDTRYAGTIRFHEAQACIGIMFATLCIACVISLRY